MHRKIAETLESAEHVALSQPELLAHHFSEANVPESAIEYWQKAGERAVRRSANAEAVHHLRAGLELLRQLGRRPRAMPKSFRCKWDWEPP